MNFRITTSLPSRSDNKEFATFVQTQRQTDGLAPLKGSFSASPTTLFDLTSSSTGTVVFPSPLSSSPIVVLSLKGKEDPFDDVLAIPSILSSSPTGFSYRVSSIAPVQNSVFVDSTGAVGQGASLTIVDGNPGITYTDASNINIKFVRSLDPDGKRWGQPVIVDSTIPFITTSTSLEIVSENPAVSYFDVQFSDLKFCRAIDSTGSAWGSPVIVDSIGVVGDWSSLEVVSNFPAISYFDASNSNLKFVRALNPEGSSWGIPLTVHNSTGTVGTHTSLKVVDGNPSITYYDSTNTDLMFIRAIDSEGTTWGSPQTIVSTNAIGQWTSLQIVGGNPAISFYDSSLGDLCFIRALNPQGTGSWGPVQRLDTFGVVGLYTSLSIINGNPAISYYDNLGGDLKYIRALDSTGSTWGNTRTIENDIRPSGLFTSLTEVNGKAGIAYYDSGDTNLKFIRDRDLVPEFNYIAM